MAEFDPRQYLAEKLGPTPGPMPTPQMAEFDPRQYLAEKLGHAPAQEKTQTSIASPGQTFLSSLAPEGALSAISGGIEAAPTFLKEGFGKGIEKYRKERDYARGLLEEASKENPRAASIGKIAGIAPFVLAAPAEIPAQAALGGIYSALNSKADATRLNDPEQRKQLAGDVGTGLLSGGGGAAATIYAPVTTAALGLGSLGGEITWGNPTGALTGAALGLLTRGGLAAANPATREFLASKILGNKFKVSPEAVSRIEAAQKEGLTPDQIPGFTLTENEEAKRSADALLKSGTFGGSRLRKQVEPYQKAISEGTQDILSEATPKSSYEVGKDVQKGVRQKAESLIAPATEAYNQLENNYYDKPISVGSIKDIEEVIDNLKSQPGLGKEAKGIIAEIRSDLPKLSTIGDLKKARTNIGNQIKKDNFGNVTSDKNALNIVSQINEALTAARDNSIKEIDLSGAGSAAQGLADTTYKKAAKTLSESLPYGQQGGKGILRPVEKLEQVTPENVRKELGLMQNTELRNNFAKTFPEEAELLRRAELAKVKASSQPPQGELQRNPGRVLQEIFGEPRGTPNYGPEAKEFLLGENLGKAENIRAMYQGLPQNYNPSGTASQISWLQSFMRPRETLGSYLQYKKLNFQSPDVKALVDQMAGKMPGKSKAEIVEGLIKKGLLGRRGLITKEN